MSITHEDDLVDDRTLGQVARGGLIDESLDSLGHSSVATQIADIASAARGHVNIAVFGPWGSGKSSLAALIAQALKTAPKRDRLRVIVFDAWKNGGDDFSINFLNEVGAAVSKRRGKRVQRRLFESRRTLNLPFGLTGLPRWLRFILLALIVAVLTIGAPLAYTFAQAGWNWAEGSFDVLVNNVKGWFSFAISGTVILAILGVASEVTRASVEEVAPSHVTQFRELFDEVVRGRGRYVIFIDELDRCETEDVLRVLNGLRTFLGHDNCTFVAAFDRAAVASAISSSIKSKLPARELDAYYTSAGEFLDKIFQYQVSLPPQTSHTFRRMASSLVGRKGGVWADLRTHLGDQMADLISLLSPVHVVSPRRTKVILNAFAINARAFETILETSWLDRAMEVAVFTVLQTEFPQLAEDMIAEPDLPRYLVDSRAVARRDSLRRLIGRYRRAEVELDELQPASTASEELDLRQILDAQWKALEDYLSRVLSLRFGFPRPDIVLMSRSPLAARFEDPGIYTALIRAVDQDPSTTLEVLESASPADLQASIDFLCMEAEGLASNEIRRVANVVGEAILRQSNASRPTTFTALWRRADSDSRQPIDWVTAEALEGFAGQLAKVEMPDYLSRVLRRSASAGVPTDAATARVVENLPQSIFARGLVSLQAAILGGLDEDGLALSTSISRAGRDAPSWLSPKLRSRIAALLDVPIPEEEPPVASTAAALAAAQQEYDESVAAASDLRESRLTALLVALGDAWTQLSELPEGLQWIAISVQELVVDSARRDATLDELLRALPEVERLDLQLRLIASHPDDLAGRWNFAALPIEAVDTARKTVEVIAGRLAGGDVLARPSLIAALAQLAPQVRPASDETLQSVAKFAAEVIPGSPMGLFRDANAVLRAAHQAELDHEALDGIAVSMYAQYVNGPAIGLDIVGLLQEMRLGTIAFQVALRDELARGHATLPPDLLARIAIAVAHNEHRGLGRATPVPLEIVRNALPLDTDRTILNSWMETGPRFDQLTRVASIAALDGVTADVWRRYSERAGVKSRGAAWEHGVARGFDSTRLLAVAAAGIGRPTYVKQKDFMVAGPNETERMRATRQFLTLPQGNRTSAEVALSTVVGLSKVTPRLRVGDAPLVADLLLVNSAAFSDSERSTARVLTPLWFGGLRRTLSSGGRRLSAADLL